MMQKINLNRYVKLVFLMTIWTSNLLAQCEDLILPKFNKTIHSQLLKYGESLQDLSYNDLELRLLYREINIKDKCLEVRFFVLSLFGSHTHSYIAILKNEDLKIIETIDFFKDFALLLDSLESQKFNNITTGDLVFLLREFKDVYDRNIKEKKDRGLPNLKPQLPQLSED